MNSLTMVQYNNGELILHVCVYVGACARRVRVYFFLQPGYSSTFFLFYSLSFYTCIPWFWCVFGVSTLLMDGDY